MASNVALHPTRNYRWFSGFGNMFSKENQQWWGTRKWLIQVAVWLVLINGMVLFISVILPNLNKTQQALQTMSASEAAAENNLVRLVLSEPGATVLEFEQQKFDLEDIFLKIVEGGNNGK